MAITKDKKKEIYEKVQDIVKTATTLVFVNFHGFAHGDENEMRRTLNKESVGYYVAKKTIVKKVLNEQGYKGELPALEGEMAVAYGEDLIAPARLTYEFAKKHKDNLAIIGGVFDGAFMSKDEMLSIATIPSLQTLHGQVVNLINSPIQGFVSVLHQVAEQRQ